MREEGTPGLRALMSMVCPKLAEIKANTLASLLLKVVTAGTKSIAAKDKTRSGNGSSSGIAAKREVEENKPAGSKGVKAENAAGTTQAAKKARSS